MTQTPPKRKTKRAWFISFCVLTLWMLAPIAFVISMVSFAMWTLPSWAVIRWAVALAAGVAGYLMLDDFVNKKDRSQ